MKIAINSLLIAQDESKFEKLKIEHINSLKRVQYFENGFMCTH